MQFFEQRLLEALTPREVTLVNTPTGIASGGDFFTTSIQPQNDPSNFRVQFILGAAIPGATLRLHSSARTLEGDVLTLVGTLGANILHVLDIPVTRDFSYNLLPTDTTTLLYAHVFEIGGTLVG